MNRIGTPLAAGLLALALGAGPLRAAGREAATVDAAAEVLRDLGGLPFRGIPPALLQDAKAVVVLPNVLKAGFLVGGRFGRGVALLRARDGSWANPVFVTLAGGGVGFQAGVQSTDIVLVFKTTKGLDRILSGRDKLTLGADVAVAAGPVGRQAGAGTDGGLGAEIYSYSRSRGLFAGVSLEGAGLLTDLAANEAYYRLRGGRPAAIAAGEIPAPAGAVNLRAELTRLTPVPAPAVVVPAPPPLPPAPTAVPAPAAPSPPPSR